MALPISLDAFASPASGDCYRLYVVMFNPSDFPGKYVVREHRVFPGGTPVASLFAYVVDDLAAARACLPEGLLRMAPMPGDDKVIVEVWL